MSRGRECCPYPLGHFRTLLLWLQHQLELHWAPRFSYQIVHLLCGNAFFTFALAKEKWSAQKKRKRHRNLKLNPKPKPSCSPIPPPAPGRNLSGVEALRQAVCFWGSDLHLRCSSIGYISRTLCHGSCTIRKASQTFCLPSLPAPFAPLAFLPTFLHCLTLQRISLTCILKNSFALAIFQFGLLRSCLQNIKKDACRYA